MTIDELAALEQRVTEKLHAALPEWPVADDPMSKLEFLEPVAIPSDWPQFPRARWVTYPGRRAVSLTLAGALIERGLLAEAATLLEYGGRERIA